MSIENPKPYADILHSVSGRTHDIGEPCPECDGRELDTLRAEVGYWQRQHDEEARRAANFEQRCIELEAALREVQYRLQGARIWGGTDWVYNPLAPPLYLSTLRMVTELLDTTRARALGEDKP